MPAELPPDDDNSEVLEKLDALMRKHHQPAPPPSKPAAPAPAKLSPTLPPPAPPAPAPEPVSDDIPTLTDIVEEPAFPSAHQEMGAPPDSAVRSLEARLHRELEDRIVPQLSLAFQQALDKLLQDAKREISATVREHLATETPARDGTDQH